MDADTIILLQDRNAAWRLLRARNAPLVLSFLGRVFVEENAGARPASYLVERLEEHLDVLARDGEERYQGDPLHYLDEWARHEVGWLRRFYADRSDEVHYDATPALEKAYAFVQSLRSRPSVGTESRLHTLVELLRQIAYGSETDPDTRLAELHRRRAEIDREIAEVESGTIAPMGDTALRERYAFFASTARDLLSDFREVEENFRALDRAARERIATWDGGKGELLASLVGDRTDIAASDEGRSFQAFYEFLLSQDRQDELTELLSKVQSLDAVETDPRMRMVHHDWFDAAERTQQTVRRLSEQLRRFLDDQVWVENRRVLELVRSIEAVALELRDSSPEAGMEIDESRLQISLPFERPLYDPAPTSEVDSELETAEEELDTAVLFEQTFVDQARLAEQIRTVLPARSSTSLAEILELYPLREGIAELVAYLALTDEDLHIELDEGREVRLEYVDDQARRRTVRMPEATVSRR